MGLTIKNLFETGIDFLLEGIEGNGAADFKKAKSIFECIARSTKTTAMQKTAAYFYAYQASRFLREGKKIRYANAKLVHSHPKSGDFRYSTGPWSGHNSWSSWNDSEIATVLVGPATYKFFRFLAGVLGRSTEAIRFIHRYVYQPHPMWRVSNRRYSRVRQARNVAEKLGL